MKSCILILLWLTASASALRAQGSLADDLRQVGVFIKKGDYAEAVHRNTRLLKRAEESGDCYYQSMAVFKAGELNLFLQDKQHAIQDFREGIRLYETCKIDTAYWLCLRYLGATYFGLSQGDSALHYLNEAYNLVKNTTKYSLIASTAGMIGEVYRDVFKNNEKALPYYDISLQNALRSNDYEALGYAYLRYGSFRVNQLKNCAGNALLEKALALFEEHEDMEGILFVTKSLAINYAQCNEPEQAAQTTRKLLKLQDSFFKKQVADKAAYYRELYETDKKDLALKAASVKRQQLTYIFIALLAVSLSVLAWLYHRYKAKKKAETEKQIAAERLLRFKAVIDTEEKERERIARELHDGIGHLLTGAKLNVSAMETASQGNKALAENAMKILDEALAETRTISHNLMPATLSELGFNNAIQQLARKINKAGQVHINLELQDDVAIRSRFIATTIYRIIQEALNNMLKHAGATLISIQMNEAQGMLILNLSDNGKGFDTNNIRQSEGLGWKNIYARVEVLNGSIDVHSIFHQGTHIHITIPHEQ